MINKAKSRSASVHATGSSFVRRCRDDSHEAQGSHKGKRMDSTRSKKEPQHVPRVRMPVRHVQLILSLRQSGRLAADVPPFRIALTPQANDSPWPPASKEAHRRDTTETPSAVPRPRL